VFIVFSCLGLLSCIELCIFLCRLVLFVSTLAKWLAGKTYSRDIFSIEGFPLQRSDWRVIYCNGLLYVFQTRNVDRPNPKRHQPDTCRPLETGPWTRSSWTSDAMAHAGYAKMMMMMMITLSSFSLISLF